MAGYLHIFFVCLLIKNQQRFPIQTQPAELSSIGLYFTVLAPMAAGFAMTLAFPLFSRSISMLTSQNTVASSTIVAVLILVNLFCIFVHNRNIERGYSRTAHLTELTFFSSVVGWLIFSIATHQITSGSLSSRLLLLSPTEFQTWIGIQIPSLLFGVLSLLPATFILPLHLWENCPSKMERFIGIMLFVSGCTLARFCNFLVETENLNSSILLSFLSGLFLVVVLLSKQMNLGTRSIQVGIMFTFCLAMFFIDSFPFFSIRGCDPVWAMEDSRGYFLSSRCFDGELRSQLNGRTLNSPNPKDRVISLQYWRRCDETERQLVQDRAQIISKRDFYKKRPEFYWFEAERQLMFENKCFL